MSRIMIDHKVNIESIFARSPDMDVPCRVTRVEAV